MKNFTYRSVEEKENIEAILRQRKRKLNRQQIVSAGIMGTILLLLFLYLGFRVYYTEFDGYVHVDANKIRTPFNIYLDSVYVKTGDVVAPGDTLYSYYMLDMLVEQANLNNEPAIIVRNRDLTLRRETLAQELKVLRVKEEELRKQIAIEEYNICFGLSDNAHKLTLERELKVAVAQESAYEHDLDVLRTMLRETHPVFGKWAGASKRHVSQIYDDANSYVMRGAINYRLASDSAIVTNVNAPSRMIFFAQEEILAKQHINLEENNLQVLAYVPVEKIKDINKNSQVDVLVTDELVLRAHVSVLGLRTETIPEHLRSFFSKNTTALVAVLRFDPGQSAPFWALTSGLPVTVRVRNFNTWKRKRSASDYLWFITGEGLMKSAPESYLND